MLAHKAVTAKHGEGQGRDDETFHLLFMMFAERKLVSYNTITTIHMT